MIKGDKWIFFEILHCNGELQFRCGKPLLDEKHIVEKYALITFYYFASYIELLFFGSKHESTVCI